MLWLSLLIVNSGLNQRRGKEGKLAQKKREDTIIYLDRFFPQFWLCTFAEDTVDIFSGTFHEILKSNLGFG